MWEVKLTGFVMTEIQRIEQGKVRVIIRLIFDRICKHWMSFLQFITWANDPESHIKKLDIYGIDCTIMFFPQYLCYEGCTD